MYSSERQDEIARIIDLEGRVTVTSLARKFDVTDDCIRKDLRQLVSQGRCRKVYGGAVRIEGEVNRNVAERVDTLRSQKQAIAAKAMELISPRQTIYLDFSSINILLGEMIAASKMSITIVSNSVDVMRAACRGGAARAFCPGGTYSMEYNGFVGPLAAHALDAYRFDAAFMGAVGVDAQDGDVLTLDLDDVPAKQAAIARASQCVLLCGTDKLRRTGTYRYASLDDFDIAICDSDRPGAVAGLRAAGIEVL